MLRINAEVVRPSGVVVFTDNAHGCNGELLNVDEVHCVGYGGGAEALLRMLSIAEVGDVVVNGGAVLEKAFAERYENARKLGSRLVGGVADVGKRPGPRDLEIGGVPHARIVHGGAQ